MSKSSENVKKWRQIAKIVVIECLGGKCQICGYNRCKTALETHHINPLEKDFTLSFILSSCRSWELIYEEMTKCILLCTNCHREVHENLACIPDTFCKFDRQKADLIRSQLSSQKTRKKRTTVEENKNTFVRYKKYVKDSKKKENLKCNHSLRINTISNSDIDFKSYGWVTDVAKLIGISPQKVTPWMKRHMNDFYKECFKRI